MPINHRNPPEPGEYDCSTTNCEYPSCDCYDRADAGLPPATQPSDHPAPGGEHGTTNSVERWVGVDPSAGERLRLLDDFSVTLTGALVDLRTARDACDGLSHLPGCCHKGGWEG